MAAPAVASSSIATAEPTGGQLAISYPSGIAAGDLLVLWSSTHNSVPTPSGWILLQSDTDWSYHYMWYRIATGAESGSLSVSVGSSQSVLGMVRVTGHDIDLPIEASGKTPTGAAPSLASGGEDRLLLAAVTSRADTNPPSWSAPPGMTLVRTGSAQYSFAHLGIAQETVGLGLTGTKAFPTYPGWPHTAILIRPASVPDPPDPDPPVGDLEIRDIKISTNAPVGASFSIPWPSTEAGDIVILFVISGQPVVSVSPNVWSDVIEPYGENGYGDLIVSTVATGNESGNITVQVAADNQSVGIAMSISGARDVDPFEFADADGGQLTLPHTTEGPGRLHISFMAEAERETVTYTAPSGMVLGGQGVAQWGWRSAAVAYEKVDSAGLVPAKAWGMNPSPSWEGVYSIFIAPTAAPEPPIPEASDVRVWTGTEWRESSIQAWDGDTWLGGVG